MHPKWSSIRPKPNLASISSIFILIFSVLDRCK